MKINEKIVFSYLQCYVQITLKILLFSCLLCSALKVTKGDSKNAKKKNNKKTSKNKSSLSRGSKKKPGVPSVSNDLSQKLYATMEKHKEVRQPPGVSTSAPGKEAV